MNHRKPKGFTLVELLVVIVIISMLAALLIPAITGARARARRTECENNQKQLAVAIQHYESAKGRLPGYINRYPAGLPAMDPKNPSQLHPDVQVFAWPVVLLEYIGRTDAWEIWRDNSIPLTGDGGKLTWKNSDGTRNSNFGAVFLEQMVCPADPEKKGRRENPIAHLSYVANCGLWDGRPGAPTPPDSPTNGVFLDGFVYGSTVPVRTVPVRTESIHDGAGQTLMFSENIQASTWYYGAADNAYPFPAVTNINDCIEANIGMVWTPATAIGTPPVVDTANDPPDGPAKPAPYTGNFIWNRVNQDIDGQYIVDAPPPSDPEPETDIYHARPSSYHPGGVVVSYCDGHQSFMDEGVDYDVYRAQMVANDNAAKDTAAGGEYFEP